MVLAGIARGGVQQRRGSSAATRLEEDGNEHYEDGCMHRGVSSFVPKGQSLGEMHTRLKELDRRGNPDRRHCDYRIRIRFSTISRCSLRSGASTVPTGGSCLRSASNGLW